MARPTKQGLDYFPLDVEMDDDFDLIEAEYGIVGFGVLIKLYQKIYLEGYYYPWTEKELLLFSKRVSVDRNTVASIVSDSIKWGIFNKKIYDKYNILTSRGIQKRYIAAVYKRINVEMIKEYLLVDVSEKTYITVISISDINNDVSDIGNPLASDVSVDKSTQSKVKESKVYSSSNSSSPHSDFEDVYKLFFTIVGKPAQQEVMALNKLLTEYGKDKLLRCIPLCSNMEELTMLLNGR